MNRRMSVLKQLAKMLREAPEKTPQEDGQSSVDAQIDKYLSSYEAEAKTAKNEGLDFRSMTRRFLLEAGEDEETDDAGGDEASGEEDAEEKPAEDEESGEEKDDTAAEEPEKEKITLEDFDVVSYVSSLMRLVDNYDSLLEMKNTILRRAYNKLAENYDQEVLDSFNEELLETYGTEIGKSDLDMQDKFAAPKAGAAGPMGGSA